MTRLLIDETIVQRWQSFFEDRLKSDIETFATEYPEKKSIIIDYWILDEASPELADYTMKHPVNSFFYAEKALERLDTISDVKLIDAHVRLRNLPDKKQMNTIGSKTVGKLISVDGLVKRTTEPRLRAKIAVFICQKCGANIMVEQETDILKEPAVCYEDQGGCARNSKFSFNKQLSTMRDMQRAELQELLERTQGRQPEKLILMLDDDLVRSIYPGEQVTINGYILPSERRKGQELLTDFGKVFIVNNIEKRESKFEDIKITDADEKKILMMSKDPLLYEKIVHSIAPSIYGLEVEKLALALQLVGGVMKPQEDGTNIRGDIHIFLVGDPGTAKSQLLVYISKLAPRSVFCDGKGSSTAGLTASVTKDEFGEGNWTLEAGALVLADGGIAIVDELDKMNNSERNALHTALEQQEIHISKAGINASLKTRCALLAAANPKTGRFDSFKPIAEQIELPMTLLSRFDLIFPIFDKPNKERDSELAKHIGDVHTNHVKKPFYTSEELTKYMSYARRLTPMVDDQAREKITAYYLDKRFKSTDNIAMTPRQLEALYRLSEASAKLRISTVVTEDDANRAISIFDEYMTRIAIDHETGNFDIDIVTAGVSMTQRNRMQTLMQIIQDICHIHDVATPEAILEQAERFGIPRGRAEEGIEKLKIDGYIYEPSYGKYRIR